MIRRAAIILAVTILTLLSAKVYAENLTQEEIKDNMEEALKKVFEEHRKQAKKSGEKNIRSVENNPDFIQTYKWGAEIDKWILPKGIFAITPKNEKPLVEIVDEIHKYPGSNDRKKYPNSSPCLELYINQILRAYYFQSYDYSQKGSDTVATIAKTMSKLLNNLSDAAWTNSLIVKVAFRPPAEELWDRNIKQSRAFNKMACEGMLLKKTL